MRVLITNDYGTPMGGAGIYCLRLRQALRERGHEVALASCAAYSAGYTSEADYEYPDVRGTNRISRSLKYLNNPEAIEAFQAILSDFRPDIVHTGLFVPLSLAVLRTLAKIPTVYHAHSHFLSCPSRRRMLPNRTLCPYVEGWQCVRNGCFPALTLPLIWRRHQLIQRYKGSISLAIGPSSYITDDLQRMGLPRVERLLHGMPLADRLQRDPRSEILFVGRLSKEKGADVLLDAMSRVHRTHPDVRLVFAGDGPLRQELEQTSEALGISALVDFAGWISNEELPRLHARATAMVIPSVCPETFGLVTLEAQMWGTPVIGTDIGGTRDLVVHGQTGLRCRPDDPTDMANQIRYLLDHPGKAELMADAARSFVEHNCSMDSHVNQLLELYTSILT
jgi:glycosyltransferase involved in cell wall biosynthesis